jgi:hypothetical protein
MMLRLLRLTRSLVSSKQSTRVNVTSNNVQSGKLIVFPCLTVHTLNMIRLQRELTLREILLKVIVNQCVFTVKLTEIRVLHTKTGRLFNITNQRLMIQL